MNVNKECIQGINSKVNFLNKKIKKYHELSLS